MRNAELCEVPSFFRVSFESSVFAPHNAPYMLLCLCVCRFMRDAELCEVPSFPHVYLDSVDASADDVAALILRTCQEVAADMLVVAHREKVRSTLLLLLLLHMFGGTLRCIAGYGPLAACQITILLSDVGLSTSCFVCGEQPHNVHRQLCKQTTVA
jgi:hypothetical protein